MIAIKYRIDWQTFDYEHYKLSNHFQIGILFELISCRIKDSEIRPSVEAHSFNTWINERSFSTHP